LRKATSHFRAGLQLGRLPRDGSPRTTRRSEQSERSPGCSGSPRVTRPTYCCAVKSRLPRVAVTRGFALSSPRYPHRLRQTSGKSSTDRSDRREHKTPFSGSLQ
jgi:hypothetical protein